MENHRRTRRPPPPPPPIAGRRQHGELIGDRVWDSAIGAVEARREIGIDSPDYLVLEFRSWDAGSREVFEGRFNATVVDERSLRRPVTQVLAKPPTGAHYEELGSRIAGLANQPGGLASAPNEIRLRQAKSRDLDAAKGTGADVPSDIAATPSSLLVMESENWGPAIESALQALGITIVARHVEEREATRVLVQFGSLRSVEEFEREARTYGADPTETAVLPPGIRRSFFDALEWAETIRPEDRLGPRVTKGGFPDTETFPLDVDLWHPGSREGALAVLSSLQKVCARHNCRISEEVRTSSLVLARVNATRALVDALVRLELVARIELPPELPAAYAALFDPIAPLPETVQPTGNEQTIAVVDSGVLAGHPLLRGWVLEERDFDTGENTATDLQGHGTAVAGLAIYGDVANCLTSGRWYPRVMVLSAKVLRQHPEDPSRTAFSESHRPERVVRDAILHFHRERGCRVFNLSIGDPDDVYIGGRQSSWAEILDQLARELDVVIVVSAGNEFDPPWPLASPTRSLFQARLRDERLGALRSRICSPATACIALTVGALTRSERPRTLGSFAAAPLGAPAPFSRLGPGYQPRESQRSIKPDFVAFGGNYGVQDLTGSNSRWLKDDIYLGEPTTRLNLSDGRFVSAISGTSFAAPHISFSAALALDAAKAALGTDTPQANSVRALLGACTRVPPCGSEWLLDPKEHETWAKLRLVGYGQVDAPSVESSIQNDVCLIAEDNLREEHWHLYAIPIPPSFIGVSGRRGITVSLAFDPPVRASRRDYLSRTMSIEVLKGLTPEEVAKFRTRVPGRKAGANPPKSKILELRPPKTDVQWSTLQVRRYAWSKASTRSFPGTGGGSDPVFHILVTCQKRFPSGEDPRQRYGLAVRLWHEGESAKLHQELRTRVRGRVPTRIRIEPQG
ncbi:MAG: S8 family peptidase [Planctomycetes bacterium]|nr:S8 family peptidase [Planctomycetota bacterium]